MLSGYKTDAVNMNMLQLKLQATYVYCMEQMPMITELGTQNGIDMPGIRNDVCRTDTCSSEVVAYFSLDNR